MYLATELVVHGTVYTSVLQHHLLIQADRTTGLLHLSRWSFMTSSASWCVTNSCREYLAEPNCRLTVHEEIVQRNTNVLNIKESVMNYSLICICSDHTTTVCSPIVQETNVLFMSFLKIISRRSSKQELSQPLRGYFNKNKSHPQAGSCVLNGSWLAEQHKPVWSVSTPLLWLRKCFGCVSHRPLRGGRPHQSVCQSLDSTGSTDAATRTRKRLFWLLLVTDRSREASVLRTTARKRRNMF